MSKTKKAKASELSKRVWYTVGLLLLVGTAFICLVGVADKVKENKKSLVGRPSRGDGLSRNGDPVGEGTIAEQLEEDVQLKTAARDADTEEAAKASVGAEQVVEGSGIAKFGKFKKRAVKLGPPGDYLQPQARSNLTICGFTYAEEPSVRVQTEQGHRCKCYAQHCNDLEYPQQSFIITGAKSAATIKPALEQVYSSKTTVETIIHSGGLRYPAYNTLMQSLVSNKVERDGYQGNSYLIFTEADRDKQELDDALIRFANGLQVSLSNETDSFSTLPILQSRRDAHSEDTAQNCKKFKSFDNSFIIQYFKRPRNIVQIVKRLKAQKGKNEILVNDDSGTEVGVWIRELEKGDPISYTVLVAPNIHEIRGYNRLAKMARGKLLVLLQDDDYPSYGGRWLRHAHHLFKMNEKLGLVGGFTGTIQGGPMTDKYGVRRAQIKFRSGFRQPFMFATLVNMGPFLIRRSFFVESGMFNGNFSCRGEAGIGFDYEYALRTWYLGYHVGVFKSEMDYHVGNWASSGTRSNRAAYKKRQLIEKRNTRYHKGTYGPRDKLCPDCLDFYYRQGLHGRPNQFSTPYNKLKGVGVLVHDMNYALKKNATKF